MNSEVTLEDLLRREPDYNLCSCFGHSWALARPDGPVELGVRVRLYCQRCGAERLDTYSYAGTLNVRSYKYPPGYLFTKGGRVPVELFRQAIVRQQGRIRRPRKKAS